eukprot:1138994-Prorocentrum_minimum.AAC.2
MGRSGALAADVSAVLNMVAHGSAAECRLGKQLLRAYTTNFPEVRWCQPCLSQLLSLLQESEESTLG